MRDYIDRNKLRIQREALEKIGELIETGDEDGFVAAVKSWKKEITPDELKDWIRRFRAACAEKRGPV